MPVRHLRLGLSIDQRSLEFFEWMRGKLMGSGTGFGTFSRMISMFEGNNVAHIPLIEFRDSGASEERIHEAVSTAIRDKDRVVLPNIERLLPNRTVHLSGKAAASDGIVSLRATNVTPLTLYFAERMLTMPGFASPYTLSLLSPELLIAADEPVTERFARVLKDMSPMPASVISDHLLLIDVTDGFNHQQTKVIYHFID